jgi:hypothetical protein
MTLRTAVALVFAACNFEAQAATMIERARGVMWLRGGLEVAHAHVPRAASMSGAVLAARPGPGPTAFPGDPTASADRAIPFVGLPGTLYGGSDMPAQPVPLSTEMRTVMPLVTRVAADYQLNPALLLAVIHAESRFNPDALSPRGAVGLMQLMPATAQQYVSLDPRDPASNVRAGAAHLHYLLTRYGDLSLALAAYNAGERAVERHGMQVPPYAETRQYVPRVLALFRNYQSHLLHQSPSSYASDQAHEARQPAAGIGAQRVDPPLVPSIRIGKQINFVLSRENGLFKH